MSKPGERATRGRLAKGDTEDLHAEPEDALPDVEATPKSDTKEPIHTSSSSSVLTTPPGKDTPKPKDPLKPGAPPSTTSKKAMMADIKLMMAKTAKDITNNLNAKHDLERTKHDNEMQIQIEAVKKITQDFNDMKIKTLTETQASPFETPRATRPQDLAYRQTLTSSKTAKVKETTEAASARKTET